MNREESVLARHAHVQANDDPQAGDARLRAVFDNAPDGIVVADVATKKLEFGNPSFCRMLGYSPEELLTLDVLMIHPPRDLPRVLSEFERQAQHGQSLAKDLPVLRKDGSIFFADISSFPITLHGKHCLVGFFRDVTERRHAERMRMLEHGVNACLAGNGDGDVLWAILDLVCDTFSWDYGEFWRFDAADRTLHLEERRIVPEVDTARRFFEISAGAVFNASQGLPGLVLRMGEPLWIVDVCTDPRVVRRVAASQAGLHGAFLMPLSAEHKTIGVLGFWSRAMRPPDDLLLAAARVIGSQIGAFLLRKQSEEELRRFRIAMDHSADLIALVDRATMKFVDVNATSCRLLGYTREELLGMGPVDVTPRSNADLQSAYDNLISGSEADGGELENRSTGLFLRRDGSNFPFELTRRIVQSNGRCLIVSVARDISERRAAEERLQYQARHDALTDLPNRVLFRDRLDQALAQAKRKQWHMAVLFIDVDRFKVVNDTLGHPVGDLLLKEVAAHVKSALRDGDTVGRLGGDEFGVILSELHRAQDALHVVNKIAETISRPINIDGNDLFVNVSIGITMYPGDSDDAETLIKNADTAMYRAKESGRNTYRFYEPQMNERALERIRMEGELRRAIDREEFVLHYQPVINLSDGSICGAEALVRWHHPDRGLIPPGIFIPLLEETGLILPASDWILRQACRQVRAWGEAGIAPPPVAVNISARQFQQRQVAESILDTVASSGVEPSQISLEITESTVMANPEETAQVLVKLRSSGFRVAIDDFGTGHANLGYLKRLPIDVLKIDRSFIDDIEHDADNAAIVQAVVGLAHTLRLQVIAEGVETAVQLDFLRRVGCDAVQGFYFSRPVAADEFAQLLLGRSLHPLAPITDRCTAPSAAPTCRK